MNKDISGASIDKQDDKWTLAKQFSELPIGNFEINSWLEDRKAYKHNRRNIRENRCV